MLNAYVCTSLADPFSEEGERLDGNNSPLIQGNINFKHIAFSYPTRKEMPVFKSLFSLPSFAARLASDELITALL
jgi:hypothetical protein